MQEPTVPHQSIGKNLVETWLLLSFSMFLNSIRNFEVQHAILTTLQSFMSAYSYDLGKMQTSRLSLEMMLGAQRNREVLKNQGMVQINDISQAVAATSFLYDNSTFFILSIVPFEGCLLSEQDSAYHESPISIKNTGG